MLKSKVPKQMKVLADFVTVNPEREVRKRKETGRDARSVCT